ncbi:MAG TPA: malate:quinone oxidoreductase, partial [Roseiflexaceae bacterium]|nr:malate:quinone oxidoreductase [Roseiflexaceae bacterium]
MTTAPRATLDSDVVCIGAGIMSATLALLLKILRPQTTIAIYERLDQAGAESSDAWNNAGTGHSAFCELNYTPEREDGSVDISKAIKIAESFEVSRQFWSYLVQQGVIPEPGKFITSIPHMSFVWGDANVQFLRRRYEALQSSPLFQGMQYSTDPQQIAMWAPLIMNGRTAGEPVAATRMGIGTDVNFGTLTRSMCAFLATQPGVRLHFNYDVFDLYQDAERHWRVNLNERTTNTESEVRAGFVFIGAGGGSLPLLLKSDIPEGKSFGGFPVSGQWLVCHNPDLIKQHHAKVYGKAAVGSPPMSVPHLDTRFIEGKQALFFGPYAGFSTRFLKHGSLLDLPLSVRAANILPMMAAGLDNVAL